MVAHNPINSQQVYTTNGENEKTAPEGAIYISSQHMTYFCYFILFISSNFSDRDIDFILASAFDEVDRFLNFLEYTNATGRRTRVYFAPFEEELCSFTRRLISVVIPV